MKRTSKPHLEVAQLHVLQSCSGRTGLNGWAGGRIDPYNGHGARTVGRADPYTKLTYGTETLNTGGTETQNRGGTETLKSGGGARTVGRADP